MRCSFSVVDLNQVFKRKGCTPVCLTTVIEELLRNNEIIQETDFFKDPCETWTAWSVNVLVKKPISWSLSKVKNYVVGQNTNDLEVKYVHLRIVQELSDVILSLAEVKHNNVLYSISDIIEYCNSKTNQQISENSIRLALEWLRQKRKAILKKNSDSSSELLVKLSTQTINEITQVEEGMYKLTKQENKLIKEIELLEKEKLSVIKEVKLYLAKELRQVAKTHLRRKMELEKTIEKRAQALVNLRTLITSIEDAHSNSAVFSAYKTGSDVLKEIGKDELVENDVRDVMDEINEVLLENKERESILSETLINSESDAELENELAELLKDDGEKAFSTGDESEFENLEHRLKDLYMDVSSNTNVAVPSRKDKSLKKVECL